ncbi:tellurite resistance TerB C-terminal domain-containing protein [Mucilaginibacter sabulilitoris]|uniref:Tellurite resistance TerB C-terminal domain-containing protein n=1 Tax=Mucilaginibacter sabulilitoris TaxID=1173583 RepID=A0ABZ0TFD6_9SPHI|nr:tellurite resistance TerB C-terminal domain-containing protein [Mucilaginibacter sabulilitoris]WPU91877.1 tellurite resistance TerB C-terminal domain-containing protein [Mucilaginibacter sabulilitoris]
MKPIINQLQKRDGITVSRYQQKTLPVKIAAVFQTEANQHFGIEWQKFLVRWSSKLTISNQRIREEIASAYEKLQSKERWEFFDKLQSQENNYEDLHTGVYRLLLDKRFNQANLLELFRNLPKQTKSKPMNAPEISATAVIRSILDAVNNTKTAVQTDDASIVEISGPAIKINYETPAQLAAPIIESAQSIINYNDNQQPYIQPQSAGIYNYDPDQFKLGNLYREKLNLSAQEILWLNKFSYYSNTFTGIESAVITVIKLYLLSLKKIVRRFANETYTLSAISEDIGNAFFKYCKKNYNNTYGDFELYYKGQAEAELYNTFFKKAEQAVREAWDHKRKISTEFMVNVPEASTIFKTYLEPVMDAIVEALIPTISMPDEETEVQLNIATTTRWKGKFEDIFRTKTGDELIHALYELGRLNRKNPAVENVYYEASKFLADINKPESLRFYLRYIHADLKSAKIDNKALNKTVQKKLFATEAQLEDFQAIVAELSITQSLGPALDRVTNLYKPKRKKIVLDTEQISSVRRQHSGTVEILNTYLQDDEEELVTVLTEIIPVTGAPQNTEINVVTTTVQLNQLQIDCLQLFKENGNALESSALEAFSISRSVFKNQLIDSINDSCYELLDDILIEEDGDQYIITAMYLNRIFIS